MFQTTVTIGRNERHGNFQMEMSPEKWQHFQNDVKRSIQWITGTSVEIHKGRGEWDGVEEESAKLSILTEEELSPRSVYTLKRYMLALKVQYLQDAIAMSVNAESELV